MEKYKVCVYKDTVTQNYEGDNNLIYLVLPLDYVKGYAKSNSEYSSFEEWKNNYTADETENLFNKVITDGVEYQIEEM